MPIAPVIDVSTVKPSKGLSYKYRGPTIRLGPESAGKRIIIREKSIGRPTPIERSVVIPKAPEVAEIKKLGVREIPIKKKISWQQYHQELYDVQKNIGSQITRLQREKSEIVPNSVYTMEQDGEIIELSSEELSDLYNEGIGDLQKSYQQSQLAFQRSYDVAKKSKIFKTKQGYEYELPDTSLGWTEKEFEKIERAYRIHPLLGGFAEFGFGAVSSFAALGKPVAEYVAKKAGVKTRPVHYVSLFDVAFEPIGLSPEGSTEILMKRPVFAAGGVAGEVLQSYGMGQAVKGVKYGAKVGVKLAVKKVPSIYGRVTRVLPEEKIFAGFGKKLGETGFAKTMKLWSEGYRPGKEYFFKSLGAPVKRAGYTVQKGKYVVERSLRHPFGKRIWLSPKEIKDFYARIAKKKITDISRISRVTGGVGEVVDLKEFTKFKRGLTGFKKTYGFKRSVKPVGKQVGQVLYDEPSKGFGGFVRGQSSVFPVVDVGDVGRPNLWFETVKKSYETGYPYRFWVTESGKQIMDFAPGFGRGVSPPLPKPWISKVKGGLVRSTEAAASLIKRPVEWFRFPASSFRSGIRPGMFAPMTGFTPERISPMISGFFRSIPEEKLIFGQVKQTKKLPVIDFSFDVNQDLSQFQNMIQESEVVSEQVVLQKQLQEQKQLQDLMHKYDVITRGPVKQKIRSPPFKPPYKVPFVFPPFWFSFPVKKPRREKEISTEPFGFKYYNEYELMQRMMQDVVF